MFVASEPILFFDYLRIPYRVSQPVPDPAGTAGEPPSGLARIWVDGPAGPSRYVTWPSRQLSGDRLGSAAAGFDLQGLPIFVRLATGEETDPRTAGLGVDWVAQLPVADREGREIAFVWRSVNGSVFLPFNPDEAIEAYWSEAYATLGGRRWLRDVARRAYYRVRPLIPRRVQIGLRRSYSRIQGRTRFPGWPVETALHDFYGLVYGLFADLAGEPPPWIAPWPRPFDWALVLSHDVETREGYEAISSLRTCEEAVGCRSAWNFVPRRYEVRPSDLKLLVDAGHEVGLHGLYHDGLDLASQRLLDERLPEMQAAAEAWGAVGFRAPATQRGWDIIGRLPFDYDSSYPDTDPYEPQPGGCCSWLPFEIGKVVELPITLPQDHTLFVILQHPDESIWLKKSALIRDRGGMALMLTHPDYTATQPWIDAYRRFLEAFADDATAWRALPREVSAWWRRRSASHLVREGASWRIVGPVADEGVVTTERPR